MGGAIPSWPTVSLKGLGPELWFGYRPQSATNQKCLVPVPCPLAVPRAWPSRLAGPSRVKRRGGWTLRVAGIKIFQALQRPANGIQMSRPAHPAAGAQRKHIPRPAAGAECQLLPESPGEAAPPSGPPAARLGRGLRKGLRAQHCPGTLGSEVDLVPPTPGTHATRKSPSAVGMAGLSEQPREQTWARCPGR